MKKSQLLSVRVSSEIHEYLTSLVSTGKVKTISEAVIKAVLKEMILEGNRK